MNSHGEEYIFLINIGSIYGTSPEIVLAIANEESSDIAGENNGDELYSFA
jgi:hypothetical protein